MATRKKSSAKGNLGKNIGLVLIGLVVFAVMFGGDIYDKFFAEPTPSSTVGQFDYNTGTLPGGVDTETLSWTRNPEATTSNVLEIWEDPQCPACASFEYYFGDSIKKLADEGLVKVTYVPTGFLDQDADTNPNGYTGHTSYRAINALGCALDRGFGAEYHDVMFTRSFALLNGLIETRPDFKEGDGFTDEDLVDWAGVAGYDENKLGEFGQCVYTPEHLTWARQATVKFHENQIPGTPYISLNGVEMPTDARKSVEAFEKWIRDSVK